MGAKQSGSVCPIEALLRLLSGPWTLYILCVLRSEGPQRFNGLKRRLSGISTKILTERLRMLEGAGLVWRDLKPGVPPQVTYGLTERMADLNAVLDRLQEIALRWEPPLAGSGSDRVREILESDVQGAATGPHIEVG
jgi:DNA-binding HxlR family transcriptional regulator